MLSHEDKKDVSKAFEKKVAGKVASATNDSKSKVIHAKMGEKVGLKHKYADKLFKRGVIKKGMGEGEYRYKPAPMHKRGDTSPADFLKSNRGGYVKNKTGKDGKYE